MTRIWKRIGIGTLLIAPTLGLTAWIILTWVMVRPPSYRPERLLDVELRTWPEHDTIYQNTEFPYVLSIERNDGSLEYIGALHTLDATHPQLAEIESRWKLFNPTVALCEGRERVSRFSKRPKTGTLSESRLVRILAYQDGVPLYSLEPSYADEVTELLTMFDPSVIATYMTLRTYISDSKGLPAEKQDQLALGLLKKRTNVEGLEQTLFTVADLDDYWTRNFPESQDWRTLKTTEDVPLLAEVGNASREIRGQHMISSIFELVENGERVFAVVGASHVIRQEVELRRSLLEFKK